MQKKNTTFGLFGLLLVIFITVSGCDTGGNGGNNGTGNNGNNNGGTGNNGGNQGFLALARMDIENAHTVFIAENPETSKDELYKVTDNGNVEKVKYFDTENNIYTENMTPSSIFVLNSTYLIVRYGVGNYLINSNTGACYRYTNDLPAKNGYYASLSESIWDDSSGNLYFISGGVVKKLSITTIDNVSISTVSAPSDISIRNFGVDKAGNVAYFGSDASGNNIGRIRRNNGGYAMWPSTASPFTGGVVMFWTDFNRNLYFGVNERENGAAGYDVFIKEVILDPFSAKVYAEYRQYYDDGQIFKMKNKKIILLLRNSQYFAEVYNGNTGILRPRVNFGSYYTTSQFNWVDSVKISSASDNYFYFVGITNSMNVLVRVDPSDFSYTLLLDDGNYDIFKITVSPNDIVTFNALRMSDGAIVIGEISVMGQVRILDATLTNEVVVLERIR